MTVSSNNLISFDVELLFTSVPVKDACAIILDRLKFDRTLPDRTQLSPLEIHDLLEMCLNSTSFRWRDTFYRQTEGAAMGSPLSPVVANMFMEHFEETALQSATHKPKVWLRYVDNTFVVWQHGAEETSNFLIQHLNSQHEHIKFTMEIENEGSIPFLDTKITRTAQGSLSYQVYRKPTHTDRYLNYCSFHHPSVLRSINKTLVERAHEVSDQIHPRGELENIKRVLKCNNYPSHKICTELPPSWNPHAEQPKARVVLPYLGVACYKIQRILREADIEVRHSSSNKLQSALTTHKDKRNSKDLPDSLVNAVKFTSARRVVPLTLGLRNTRPMVGETRGTSLQSSILLISMITGSFGMKVD
ncbi:uncharacterized protein LOC129254302 [Lytechinus pictus]|uniref:uncharacterized protein LOC129254302 n=1 Tax=Lytechinus pictus TaxID=7653 RepID=UPI0030B9F669